MKAIISNSIKIAIFILPLFGALSLFAQTAQDIKGKWQGEDKAAKQMEILEDTNGQFYGKIINDTSKKSQNGHLILKKLVWDEKTKTFQGIINPPEIGQDLRVTLYFVNKDKLQFKVKKFFITKTVNFARIK